MSSPNAEETVAGVEPAAPAAEASEAGVEPAAPAAPSAPPIVEDLLSDQPPLADEIELAALVPEPERVKAPTPADTKKKPAPKASPQAPPRKSSLIYPGFHKRPGLR